MAQQTLDYLQSLYEKKLCTYPRTDSRFLTNDMAANIPVLAGISAKVCGAEIPVSMDEAAEIDGANMFQKLFYITLPLMKPAIATILIINFINCLNDLFTPLFFAQKIEVLSVAITTIPRETSYSMPWDLISTVGCVILLPIVIFVLIFEKQIMEGVMAGGVKQ